MDAIQVAALALRSLTAILFVGMGLTHFLPRTARGMARIIPPRMRRDGVLNPLNLVYFTGVCEILGGVGIVLPQTRLVAAVALTVFLIAVFPANDYASQHPEKFGRAALPFWPRYLAQLALITLALLAVSLR